MAGIKPKNIQVSDSGLIVWLWWSVAAVARELSVEIKRVCRVASSLRLSAEKPPGTMLDLRVL